MVMTEPQRSGVALWRQVADQLRAAIDRGDHAAGERLPAEFEIARRFGVNRHTVRAAIASLAQDGLVETRRGLGTIVTRTGRLSYPIGLRTRLSGGLGDQISRIESRLLGSDIEPASNEIAAQLDVSPGSQVLRMETVSAGEGRPISLATHWLAATRFADLPGHFAETGSITAAFRHFGIDDYIRQQTRIRAEGAGEAELLHLQLPKGAIVLVAAGLNTTLEGSPFHATRTRFPADRIELRIDH